MAEERSTYTEYRLLCGDHVSHPLAYPTVRYRVLKELRNRDLCGPHTLESRRVERVTQDWVTLLVEEYDEDAGDGNMLHIASLDFPCPKCSAAKTEACFNLTIWRRAQETVKEPTSWPHAERLDLLLDNKETV